MGAPQPVLAIKSTLLEQVKVPFPAHASSAQEVLDDEHRNFLIGGNHERALHAGFGVDEMVTVLSAEGESVPLEDPGEGCIGDGTERGHYGTLATSLSSETNSGARQESPSCA